MKIGITERNVDVTYHTFSDKKNRKSQFSYVSVNLSLIADYNAFGADGPAEALGHEEAIEMVRGRAFLFDPRAAFVGGAENRALVADDPTVLVVGKVDPHKRFGVVRYYAGPRRSAVFGT